MRPRPAAVVLLVLLASCSGEEPLPRFDHPLPSVTRREFLALLRARDWDALDARYDGLEAAARADIAREVDLPIAYRALSVDAPGVREGLEAWVEARPRSASARLTLGTFLEHEGWRRRGWDWARETTAEQFAGMHESFEAATRELRAALDLDPDRVEAWTALMRIAATEGDRRRLRELAEQALRRRPASFRVRRMLQANLLPRWGGSYLAMRLAARAARAHFAANPRLACLHGFADADRAEVASREERYQEGLELANRALATGEDWDFYDVRAKALAGLGRHEEAMHALGLALDLSPEEPRLLVDHAEQALASGDVRAAQADWLLLRQVDPGNEDFDWLARRLDEAGGLPAMAGAAAESGAGAGEPSVGAREACEQAVADPAPCLALQALLGQAERWEEVVAAWSAYLERNPDDALALKARAAAAYRLGQVSAALADLERGCALGDADACRVEASIRAATRSPR